MAVPKEADCAVRAGRGAVRRGGDRPDQGRSGLCAALADIGEAQLISEFKSTGGRDLRLYMKVATARKYLEQK